MKRLLLFFLGCLICSAGIAETRIAILDFELRDLTLAPGIPEELQRTASIKTMLEGELKKAGYKLTNIDASAQKQANAGSGYLFDHSDVAASLGKTVNADYILVGRLHKPSFLFAYIMGHLIRVSDGRMVGNYNVETKGGDRKLTLKAVETLTVNIDHDLDQHYLPPPPSSRHK